MLPTSRLPRLVPATLAAVLTLSAQQAPQIPATVLCRPSALLNPFLAPVSGEPVTVTYVIKIERPQLDGSIETLDSTFHVARDSRGRISRELRERLPASSAGARPLLGVVLYNPRTRMSQTIDTANRTDVELQVQLHSPAVSLQATVPASNRARIEDLGRKSISGLDVKGDRETWKDPAQLSPARQPSQSSIESWYSNDLHMIVSERRTTPLGVVVTIALSEIDRHEPPAALFKVPQGYRVIRPKSQVYSHTGFAGDAWSITPPDQDGNITGAW
jgi:hypothetical protein